MATDSPETPGWLSKLNLLVTIAFAVLAGMTKFAVDRADEQVKQLEARLKQQEVLLKESQEKRAERESVQRVQLEVYQHVVTSLERKQPELQRVASALVTSVLEDPLRGGLLTALETAGTPEVVREIRQTLARESKFRNDESVVAGSIQTATSQARSFNWEDIDYDVFWCERSGTASQRTAEAIVAQLEKEGAKGRLRVRLLPDSINARPGYQHSGFVIRLNSGEEKQAEQLKRVGDAVVGTGGGFQLSFSAQATPWYLSAFVCPAAP